MNKPLTNSQTTFGFISIREIEGLGHCGGLLIVSQIGRPIEFHCSAPIATNRAQKILYGKTYETFLYSEQIGLALIEKAKTKPNIYIANCGPLLALNNLIAEPVIVLGDEYNTEYLTHSTEFTEQRKLNSFDMDQQNLWTTAGTENGSQYEFVKSLMESFTKTLPLIEPFDRIQKAIDEAHAVAK